MLVDVMSFALDQLPPSDDLIFFYKDLDQLLEPKPLIAYAAKICKQKGQAFCEHVFGAWASALRSLSSDESNSYEKPFGFTLLNRCMVLLQCLERTEDSVADVIRAEHPNPDLWILRDIFHDGHWPGDPFEDFLHRTFASATIELVKHKLLPETVEESFPFTSDALKRDLWKLVRTKKPWRGGSASPGGLRFGLGADLMMALIDKGLPQWCWGGSSGPFNGTLLQYIIEPTAWPQMDDKEEAEGRLCVFLAERLSLEELCHQNQDGWNALSYAEDFADLAAARNYHGGLWTQVHDAIREQMEAKVREFQGSLHQLVELTESVRAGLGGNLVFFELSFRSFQNISDINVKRRNTDRLVCVGMLLGSPAAFQILITTR